MRGGTEVLVGNIVDEMKKNHDVHVITISPWRGWKSLIPTKTYENGIHVTRFYPLNLFSFIDIAAAPRYVRIIWHLLDLFNIHSYAVIRSILQSEKPDAVFTHNIKGIGYTACAAIRHAGVRHIHTVHDIQLVVASGIMYWKEEGQEKSFENRFHTWCSKLLFDSPAVVISPSHFLKNFYVSRGFFPRSNVIVLNNPIPRSADSVPERDARTAHAPLIHFFVAGALNRAKGILFLSNVFRQLTDTGIHLWIAGSGPDEEDLKKIAASDSRISLLGRLTNEELLKELRRMHYTIIPSFCYENAPTILSESFSFGVPALVANIGGAAEGVEDGINGFVFAPRDSESLRTAIKRAAHYNQYGLLSSRARQSVSGRSCTDYIKHLIQTQTQ